MTKTFAKFGCKITEVRKIGSANNYMLIQYYNLSLLFSHVEGAPSKIGNIWNNIIFSLLLTDYTLGMYIRPLVK